MEKVNDNKKLFLRLLFAFLISRDGVLFSEQETCLFAFPAGRTGIYPIPENVVRLAKDAFSESRLFKVIGMKERGMEQTDLPDTLVVE